MAKCLVIDNGSLSLKVGFSSQDSPKAIIPTLVGRNRNGESDVIAVGDEASERRAELLVSSPLSRGVVNDTAWDDMERLWRHAIDTVGVDPSETRILLSEPYYFPAKSRTKLMEIWFEKFNARSIASCTAPLLSLLSSGTSTGVVVEIGESLSNVIAVTSGGVERSHGTYKNFAVTGNHITDNLCRLLSFRGFSLGTRSAVGREIVRDIKEQLCYVAFDHKEENDLSSTLEKVYTLPDGAEVRLAEERFQATEPLFNPDMLGLECSALHTAISDAITRSAIDMRRDLYSNIYLCGGSSMFPGLPDRIEKELIAVAPPKAPVQVVHERTAPYSTWLGGAVLGLLENRKVWVHDLDYKELGAEQTASVETAPCNPYA